MIANPHLGKLVKIWYRESNQHLPYHGLKGHVMIASKGKPRNHLIRVTGGPDVVVPCGNLQQHDFESKS